MAINYTWDVRTVDVKEIENINADTVFNVHWRQLELMMLTTMLMATHKLLEYMAHKN